MNFLATIVIVNFFLINGILTTQDYNVDFEQMEYINGTEETIIDYSNSKIIRNKNREFCWNGTFQFTEDLDDNYLIKVDTSYSPTGNRPFIRSPYALPKQSACEFYRTFFEKYGRPTLEGHSNFPVASEAEPCVFPKGAWYVDCVLPKIENFPTHLHRTVIQVAFIYYKGNSMIGGLKMYFRITDKF